jgi:hypothetical protein
MEVLNNLCEQYICYMFTEQIKYSSEQSVKSYLTENEYTIEDWYRGHYSDEPLFTNYNELMIIQEMLMNYYISSGIQKNYEAVEDYEMEILKDYIYYYIHSTTFDEFKILIKQRIEEEVQLVNEDMFEEQEEVQLVNENMFEEQEEEIFEGIDFGETDSEAESEY